MNTYTAQSTVLALITAYPGITVREMVCKNRALKCIVNPAVAALRKAGRITWDNQLGPRNTRYYVATAPAAPQAPQTDPLRANAAGLVALFNDAMARVQAATNEPQLASALQTLAEIKRAEFTRAQLVAEIARLEAKFAG